MEISRDSELVEITSWVEISSGGFRVGGDFGDFD